MDCCVLFEVLVSLLVVILQFVDGFSIRGPTRSKGEQGRWRHNSASIEDTRREIADTLAPFSNFPLDLERRQNNKNMKSHRQRNHYNHHHQQHQESLYDLPEDSLLFDTISSSSSSSLSSPSSSLDSSRENTKHSLSPFSNANYNNNNNKNKYGDRLLSDEEEEEEDNEENDNDVDDNNSENNSDDEIDVIATISYPGSVIPGLDNLSLSTKIGLLPAPSKRQQGWYVQYGKRSTSSSSSTPAEDVDAKTKIMDSPINFNDLLNSKSETSSQHQHLLNSEPDEDNNDSSNSISSQKFQLNLRLRRNLEQLEKDMKIRDIAFDIVKQILDEKSNDIALQRQQQQQQQQQQQPSHSSVKRQQGWFTQYGKRSQEIVPNPFS